MPTTYERKGLLYVISGPSGVGKTTIARTIEDLVNPAGHPIETWRTLSHTTRSPRYGETDGEDYHFTSAEVFKKMTDANEFLEYASVYGHLYGTSREEVLNYTRRGHDAIRVVDVQGHASLREAVAQMIDDDAPIGGMVSIFLRPPSIERLRERLEKRGDARESLEQRLAVAEDELKQASSFDWQIENDNLSHAVVCLTQIILSEQCGH